MTERTTDQTSLPAGPETGEETAPQPPPHWEADIVAADGGTVHLRPIRPEDAEGINGLMERSSDQTRYYRFFGPMKRLSERDLHRFTHVDHVDRVAFVVLLGEQIVAVGRFDRYPGTDDAEVAFLVEDAHQRRGLGSVLLEHLAAAARERGIKNFVAEVLAQNSKMVRVFQDAGYESERSYEDGVVHLTFPIEQTEDALAVAYEREQRSESRSIARLLTPSSVAVVGASNDEGKIGNALLRHLLEYGFAGPVYPVNPGARHVRGVPAYADIESIPDDVDLAVLAVPADEVAGVVEACRRKRVRGLVVVSGGFGETGPEGRDGRAAARGRRPGLRHAGGRTQLPRHREHRPRGAAQREPGADGPRPRPGRASSPSPDRSGVALLERARSRNLGLSTFVSAGNRADVSGNDLLQYWATDPGTEVVLLHLESFGNPRKFARLARSVGRTKPVVAVKSGRHVKVTRGLAGTSVAVPEQSVAALFASAGVIRVETVAQMFDVGTLLAHQPLPVGRRVAIVGNSTAIGVLVADAILDQGLELAREEPVDIGASGTPEDFRAALQEAVDDDGVDAVVAVFLPPLMAGSKEFGPALRDVAQGSAKPIVASFLSTEGIPPELAVLDEDGMPARGSVPSYSTPERAVISLAKVAEYARWRRRPVGELPELPDVDEDAGRAIVRTRPGRGAGRPRPHRRRADRPAGRLRRAAARHADRRRRRRGGRRGRARSAIPVVLKSTAPWLRHRPDLGGRAAGPGRRRRGAGGVRRDPVRRPGDRAGDGGARRGDGRGDRRRPVVRRAGQLRARGSGDRPARRPRLPHAAAHRPGRRGAGARSAGLAAARRLPRVRAGGRRRAGGPAAARGPAGRRPAGGAAAAPGAGDRRAAEPVARRPLAGRRRRRGLRRPAHGAGRSRPPPDALAGLTSGRSGPRLCARRRGGRTAGRRAGRPESVNGASTSRAPARMRA